jgi:hypothetical protein
MIYQHAQPLISGILMKQVAFDAAMVDEMVEKSIGNSHLDKLSTYARTTLVVDPKAT